IRVQGALRGLSSIGHLENGIMEDCSSIGYLEDVPGKWHYGESHSIGHLEDGIMKIVFCWTPEDGIMEDCLLLVTWKMVL
ncbi:hypothetical protein CEXT_358011, partial [Caerostris extrusa]